VTDHADIVREALENLGNEGANLTDFPAALAALDALVAERDAANASVKSSGEFWLERVKAAEAEVARLREVLETSVGCWEEDARGWRDVLSYFNAQPDADRHDAKELIAAIEQRASTVAENARIARAALAPKEDA